ncbi:MAG: PulJ/GspJ family protein [Actinomycetota bacterium]
MKTLATRERFLKDERGFSLPEMIVTIVIMTVVFLALFSVFDMSVRVFSFGNNKVEATESARLGVEKMEREIRAAYPANVNDATPYLFFSANGTTSNPPQAMPTATQITFGNELGAEGEGNGIIECPAPDNCEYITYKLSPPSNAAPCTLSPTGCSTLLRVNTANSGDPGDPVSENAVVPGGLTFTYLKSAGDPATTEGEIAKVRVSLEIRVDPGTKNSAAQRLTTEIDLRNRQ